MWARVGEPVEAQGQRPVGGPSAQVGELDAVAGDGALCSMRAATGQLPSRGVDACVVGERSHSSACGARARARGTSTSATGATPRASWSTSRRDEPPIVLDLGTGLRPLGDVLPKSVHAPRHSRCMPPRSSPTSTGTTSSASPSSRPLRDPGARMDVYGPPQDGGPARHARRGSCKPPFFPVHMEHSGARSITSTSVTDDFAIGSAKVMARPIPHVGDHARLPDRGRRAARWPT